MSRLARAIRHDRVVTAARRFRRVYAPEITPQND